MQILNVKAENFKGLKLVEITPEAGTTCIGGENHQGKSSLLDAIAATLGGAKLCPKRPIRDGEDEARCELRLQGDESRLLPPCTVTRTWRRKDSGRVTSELEITTDDGYRAPTPQTILDDIVGPLGFDPERFLRMKPKEQADVLRGLVGLDFAELDAERQKAYDARTAVNRDGKTMKARFDAMPIHEDAPEEEVSVAALMTELQRRQAVNARNADVRREADEVRFKITEHERRIETAQAELRLLHTQLQAAEQEVNKARSAKDIASSLLEVKTAEVNSLKDADESDIQQQITESETVNRKVRENAERVTLAKDVEAGQKKSKTFSDRITAIDAEKQKMREAAKWPVDGLGYDEEGVTLLDRPFEQASASEQREAAFGIVAALNPALRFAFIKDGGLLGDKALADFARIAAEHGFQLFVERVGEGKECSVIISDGEVKQ